ncbi:PAS domain S-box protein [Adhaeribacter swui]|uniref:Sensory/regulatory protein RpfC n=1 Tax=Adhaeribacter swui TaxID=2086471 RepID=A0A7G7GA98_9BACT|nr:PAS domain S-box protein [Adhaeribacter swui]QNF34082.1 PAS domain S-box protein [Adhaeribacter swui]
MQTELLNKLQELQQQIIESENQNQLLLQKQAVLEEKLSLFAPDQLVSQASSAKPEFFKNNSDKNSGFEIVFQQIFQNSPDAMLILSAKGEIEGANRALCALLHYSAAELQQLSYLQVVDQNDPSFFLFRQEKEHNPNFKGEIVLVRKNGERFLTEISSNTYTDQNGESKCLAIIRDISNQREALMRSERDYRDLFNKANDAIIIFDLETEQIFDANDKACKLYGYTLPEFTAISLVNISKNARQGKSYLQQLRMQCTLENVDTTHFRKDGTEIHLSVNASFIDFNNKKAVLAICHDVTEQKNSERILFESEERFSAFMDNSPVLAWMKNTENWHYSYANATHKHVLGLSRDDVAGKSDYEVWPEPVAVALHQNDLEVVKSQRATEFREEILLPNGILRKFLVYKFPMQTINGDSFIAGTAIDITDLVHTQEALEESETRNRAVLATAMESIISMDYMGNILEFNPAAEKTFGYNRADVIGKKLQDIIIPPGLLNGNTSDLSCLFLTGDSRIIGRRVELTAIRANGEEFPVEISIAASGTPTTPIFTSIIQDISERKAAECALRRSEKQFRLITENMTDLVCLHEPDGRLIYVSPSVQDILGFAPDELIGKSPYSIIHPKDKSKLISIVVDVLAGNQNIKNLEYRLKRKDGVYIWVDTGLRPIFDETGNVVEVQTVSHDITARKKTEHKLKKAKVAAEISAVAKESFLANMSHEIRTPLNGILGMAGLLSKTQMSESQQKYLNIIDYSARNLLVIINDILDLAKIESGKMALEQIPFSIKEVLQSTQQSLEYKAEEKDILLIVKSFNVTNSYVVGDPHRLTQVLLNLVSNAIKFTSQGVVIIRTEVLDESATHISLLFTVKDTGIGISPEKLDIIFNGFTQADPHTSRNYGGTGLGLTISKSLVEKQGGRIWVESALGQGSEFKFELTFRKAEPDQIKKVVQEDTTVDFSSLGHRRILLAEDNEVNQFLAKSIMQNWGFTVDVAKNGKEAIDLATDCIYDLILMDIQMPEVSGTEATFQIRQLPDPVKANIPIIALTANALKGDAEKFIAAGMNDYLAKPFEELKLFQKIATNLNKPLQHSTTKLNQLHTVLPTSNSQPDKLCNLATLQAMANGKNDFLIQFFMLFINQVPPQVKAMQEAAAQANWATVTSLAHQLKSNFDTLGISSLHQPIRNLENDARQQSNLAEIPGLINKMSAIVEQVVAELRAEIARLQG